MVNAFSAYSGLSLKGTYGGGGGGGGTPTQETRSGSVAAGAWSPISSFSVKAGTQFKVVMSGTGDPDLYVRWGSAPTTTSYSCRPYASGASETCDIPVPAGTTAAYVGVRGYSSATYNLTINYTKP
jgi:vibriolysin